MRRILNAMESESSDDFMTKPFAFLGGTVNDSTWRELLIPQLEVSYFNPVVKNWTPDDERREHQARAAAKVLVFVITPKQQGFYSLVEMAVAATTDGQRRAVVLAFLNEDAGAAWTNHQMDSNRAICEMLSQYPGVYIGQNLEDTASIINSILTAET